MTERLRWNEMILLCALGLSVLPSGVALATCVGDCDGSVSVTIEELIQGTNIALATTGVEACPEFDVDGSRTVTIEELVAAVGNALDGCSQETPTATPTSTQAPSAPPTVTPTRPQGLLRLEPIGDQTVALGSLLTLTLRAAQGGGKRVTFSASPVPLPSHAALDAMSGYFTFAPDADQVGTTVVTFTVSDGVQHDSETISMTVSPPAGVTTLAGQVLTLGGAPLAGVRLVWGTAMPVETFSQADGGFFFANLPVAGAQRLLIDGSTVPNVPAGTYAVVPEIITAIAGGTNIIDAPIFLLPLDVASADPIVPGVESTITSGPVVLDGTIFPPIELTVPAGSARMDDTGAAFDGMVHISRIPDPTLGPRPLPKGLVLSVYIAIQPFGVTYDPPADLAFPNVEKFPPGAVVDILGLNHDTGRMEKVGDGIVADDGQMILSGTLKPDGSFTRHGVVRANSWHGFVPQPPAQRSDPCSGGGCGDGPACKTGSTACLSTGDLAVEHLLPSYRSHGIDRALQFEYHSTHVLPRPLVSTFWTPGNFTPVPESFSTRVTLGGVEQGTDIFFSPAFCGFACPQARFPRLLDAATFPTGLYQAALTLSCNFPISRRDDTHIEVVPVINETGSPLGAGWSLRGLERIYRSSGAELLLVDGSKQGRIFSRAQRAVAAISRAGERDSYSFAANVGDVVSLRLRRRSNQRDGGSSLDPALEVHDSRGFVVAVDDDGSIARVEGPGNDAAILELALPATDTYTVIADGRSATTGPYELFLSNARDLPLVNVSDPTTAIAPAIVSPPGDTSTLSLNLDGTFTRRAKDGTLSHYDATGRLERSVDPNGNTTRYNYADGRLATIVDPANRTTRFMYTAGRLSAVVDPADRSTLFEHDPQGNLIRITDPDGATRRFEYDDRHRLVQQTGPRGTATADPNDFVTTYEYGRDGRFMRALRPDDTTATIVANQSLGFVAPPIDCQSGTPDVGCPNNLAPPIIAPNVQAQYVDANNQRTQFAEQNTLGQPGRIIDPLNRVTTTTRNGDGNPTRILPPSGDAIRITYDDRGNEITVKDEVLGGTTTYEYDPVFNRITAVTDPRGNTSHFDYDERGNLRTVRTALERRTSFTYTAQGLLETVTDPLETMHRVSYDDSGNAAEIRRGSGADTRVTTATRNMAGAVVGVTDPENRIRTNVRDAVGRLRRIDLPGARTIEQTFDLAGNSLTLTPPGRPLHQFTYDARDRRSAYIPPEAFPGNRALGTTYDAVGQLSELTYPDGRTAHIIYDRSGEPTDVLTSDGDYKIVYSADGLLTSITAPESVLGVGYRGSVPTSYTWSGAIAGTTSWTLGRDGLVETLTIGSERPVAFTYDADLDLIQAGDLQITRHPANGLIAETTLGGLAISYEYNDFGELTGDAATFADAPLYATRYQLDKLGRLTRKVEHVGDDMRTYEYSYDAGGRLAEVRRDGAVESTYDYDPNGNRRMRVGEDGTVSATYDVQDRLQQAGGLTYTYTANGELRSKNTPTGGDRTTYTYDLYGALRSVTLPDGREIEYVVDGTGRRIGKRIDGRIVQGFLYATQGNPVAELDEQGNVVARFVYATRGHVPDYLIRADGIYRILADRLGSPRLVVNEATGAIAQRLDYGPFGELREDTNPGFQPFGFAGGLYDADTGLLRFERRDYDPETGRWTTKDPIFFHGGDTNLYAYVANDPVNHIDPTGLFLAGGLEEGVGLGLVTGGGAAGTGTATSALVAGGAVTLAFGVGIGIGLGINHVAGSRIQDLLDAIFGDPSLPRAPINPNPRPEPKTPPTKPLPDPDPKPDPGPGDKPGDCTDGAPRDPNDPCKSPKLEQVIGANGFGLQCRYRCGDGKDRCVRTAKKACAPTLVPGPAQRCLK